MQTIPTSRFGALEVDENRVIHFPEGLLGFPAQRDYVMLEHKPDSPFCWLQSIDVPDLAFVMTNPFRLKQDYLQGLSSEEERLFEMEGGSQVTVFALVTIPQGRAEEATANLLGPLVIDIASRRGKQVVLANSGYSHRHPLFLQ